MSIMTFHVGCWGYCRMADSRTMWTYGWPKFRISVFSQTISTHRSIVDIMHAAIFSLKMGATSGMPFAVSSAQVLPDKLTLASWKVADINVLA